MKLVALLIALSPTSAFAEETTTSLLPVDLPDTEKRVIVDFNIEFNPVLGSLSGRADPFGAVPSDGTYEDTSLFLNGDIALGTRGIFWPTLNIYGLGSGIFDLKGVPDAPPINPSVAYRYDDARAYFLHLAYAELEGVTETGFLGDLYLRAGRQFHFSRVGITFDGATLGYDGDHAKVAVRVGSRSSVFDRTQSDDRIFRGGLFIGGDLGWDFGPDIPLSIEAEVHHYRRDISLFVRDEPLESGAPEVEQQTTIGDLRIEFAPTDLILWLVGEFTFPAISHVRAGANFQLGTVEFMVDFDQKIGRDLFYDLATSDGLEILDRRSTYEVFRLNFVDPQPYSELSAIVAIPLADWIEIEPLFGFRVTESSQEKTSPYDASRIRYGLTTYLNFPIDKANGIESQLGYQGIWYLRGDEESETFRDTGAGGEDLSHDAFVSLRYVYGGGFRGRRLLTDRTLTVGAFGLIRVATFNNRFIDSNVNDISFGAGAEVGWQFTRFSGVRVAYEFARDSSVFYDYLGPFHMVRASLSASF